MLKTSSERTTKKERGGICAPPACQHVPQQWPVARHVARNSGHAGLLLSSLLASPARDKGMDKAAIRTERQEERERPIEVRKMAPRFQFPHAPCMLLVS